LGITGWKGREIGAKKYSEEGESRKDGFVGKEGIKAGKRKRHYK